ncbi:anti-sigma factor [Actinomycetota bacterium Odt1-20B]
MHSLAVPYALDALTPRELRRFERHLTRCATCPEEVRELAGDTVRLARAAAAAPPPELRERVLASVRLTEQEPAEVRTPVPPSRARTRAVLVPLAATGAALILAAGVLLGVRLARADHRLDQERTTAREIAHVLAAPDATATRERDAKGRGMNVVASPSQGQAVVSVTGLGDAPRGRVHQLWEMREGSAPRSQGLLEGATPVVAERLGPASSSLAVTTEPAGGSKRPTTAPLVQLALESVGFGE